MLLKKNAFRLSALISIPLIICGCASLDPQSSLKSMGQNLMSGITINGTPINEVSENGGGNRNSAQDKADPAASAMKYKVDVSGIKLGMSFYDVKKNIKALYPSANIQTFHDADNVNVTTKLEASHGVGCGRRVPNGGGSIYMTCLESTTITVDFINEKAWRVNRSTEYTTTPDGAYSPTRPTTKVTLASLAGKYGDLGKLGFDGVSTYKTYRIFGKDGYYYRPKPRSVSGAWCGDSDEEVLSSLDWSYRLSVTNGRILGNNPLDDNDVVHRIEAAIADCSESYAYLKRKDEPAQKAREKELERQKTVNPNI